MPAQGRKNVHGKAGVRFRAGYTASKNKSMLRNVVSELIVHGQVKVSPAELPQSLSLSPKRWSHSPNRAISLAVVKP